MLHRLLKRLQFFNEELISLRSYLEAWELCKDVDEKDMIFVALAIELDASLWTTDHKLAEGIRSKGFNNFYPT